MTITSDRDPAETGHVDGDRGSAYLFRGDDQYRGGAVGFAFGMEADSADIQDFAEHVLRKESRRTSRYTSFTTEIKVARRFTATRSLEPVRKIELVTLRGLESEGLIKVWGPDRVGEQLALGPRKLARQAGDVRAAMRRNGEVLIEGQIPAGLLRPAL